MKLLGSITAAAIICASQVSALSCRQPDVTNQFLGADGSTGSFSVLLGSFEFDEPLRRLRTNTPTSQVLHARFSGQALGHDGFGPTSDLDVTVTLGCAGPWCASMPTETPIIAFVELRDSGYVLDIGPCYANVFAPATPQDIATLEACMAGSC